MSVEGIDGLILGLSERVRVVVEAAKPTEAK